MKHRHILVVIALFTALALLVACGGAAEAPPPQVVESTVLVQETVVVESTVMVESTVVVESTVEVDRPVQGQTITFWSTEEQPERAAATQEILKAFEEATGIRVELVLVNEDNLPSLITSAVAAGTLPDVVFFPGDFAIGWAEQGILDTSAATAVIEELDPGTFAAGALNLVQYEGEYAAVPSDGWGQILVYRQDLFEEAGLDTPDTYENILAAAEALNDPGNNFYGITMANSADAVFTQQTFEHVALANDCQLVDEGGEVALDSPACIEAINFYVNLLNNYSPAGVQDVESTRATYFAGQAAMIVWSPFILDEMAGLRDNAFPACPECADDPAFLAKNSAIVPAFVGPSGGEPAQYGQVSYLGITAHAEVEPAQQFIEYWLDEGYVDWLAVSPEGKFPMRTGTPDEPDRFIEGWKTLETGVDRKEQLGNIYGAEVIETLIDGAGKFQRWGFTQGEGALVAALYESLIVPRTLNDVLGGSLTVEQAVQEMTAEVQELQE